MEHEGSTVYVIFAGISKIDKSFSRLLLVFSHHKLISKYTNFHCHSGCSSEVTGIAFLTDLLQIKYATPDDQNNIGLTFN